MSLSDWAIVSQKNDTGLGRLAADMRRVLGIGRHLVTASDRIAGHPANGPGETDLSFECPEPELRAVLHGLRGLILIERLWWHPRLLEIARDLGILTICIPMWEWFTGHDPQWKLCDAIVCPTRHTFSVVCSYGFRDTAVFMPVVLDLSRFAARRIQGPARLFIHNAGLVESDDRKGTGDTIRAFKKVKRDDITLLVRLQKEAALPSPDSRIQIEVGNLPDPADLYKDGDCAIQPSRMEGIGFMVLEPVACGLPVITTDYAPMNEHVVNDHMLVKPTWLKRRAYPSQWVKHAHMRLPCLDDLSRKIEWCAAHDLREISRENRSRCEQLFDEATQRRAWFDLVDALYANRLSEFLRKNERGEFT